MVSLLFSCQFGNNHDNQFIMHDSYPTYVNIIPHDICFRCYPSFYQIAMHLKSKHLPKDQIVYIFPDMRESIQEKFIWDNFKFKINELLKNKRLLNSITKNLKRVKVYSWSDIANKYIKHLSDIVRMTKNE